MHKNYLNCIFKCSEEENQLHTFTRCKPIPNHIEGSNSTKYKDIFGTIAEQSDVMGVFSKIEERRNHIKKYHLLPGGRTCQDPCTFGFISVGAADTLYICT